jgi:XTP/dITP diphosphohydrolase
VSLLFGSRNPAKRAYYQQMLSPVVGHLLGPDDYGIAVAPAENGPTAEANAALKASFYALKAGVTALAEDEMLFVDFLPPEKQPGVLGRRPSGEADDLDDNALLAYWIDVVQGVPEEKRTGRWHTAYCFAHPAGAVDTLSLDFEVRFFLPPSAVRIPGWPLSSIQGRAQAGKAHSETTPQELSELDRLQQRRLLDWLGALLAQSPGP